MRRANYRPYVIFVALLLFMMSLPQSAAEKMRDGVVGALAPAWNFFTQGSPQAIEHLQQEHQTLKSQMESMRAWLLFDKWIEEQAERLTTLVKKNEQDPFWKEFYRRRSEELCRSLEMEMLSLPAKVIYREPASWSSSVWINIGEKANQKLGKTVVAKNSPVLVGKSIVGVVEHVGASQSRVRLITDSGLVPSVRALRGETQNKALVEHVDELVNGLKGREELFTKDVASVLQRLKNQLAQEAGDHYLAKGELYGTSSPLWRSRNQVLKGVGFNYDFADAEGPARQLRSEELPLLKVGDLLVTTGMDGIFPAGFWVATVSTVHVLREGACAYEIEANATAGNLDDLTHVTVLPPVHVESLETSK